jgi:NAD(P)-dependent dehydrogenase (short-subunit alcohol dehydrogenase family)
MAGLTGTTSIVTGAARGIGRATAEHLGTLGSRVVALDVDPTVRDRADWTAVVGDVTHGDIRQAALAAAGTQGEPLGILVNCAFTEERASILDGTDDGWTATWSVSLQAAVSLSREFVRALEGRPGAVVNVASVHAYGAAPGFAAYAAAKAAMVSFTRSAAVEWGPLGVRVNAVAPGFVAVERNRHLWSDPERLAALLRPTPLARAACPEEVARCIGFLAGPDASYVTGAVLPVDGGLLARLPEGERP